MVYRKGERPVPRPLDRWASEHPGTGAIASGSSWLDAWVAQKGPPLGRLAQITGIPGARLWTLTGAVRSPGPSWTRSPAPGRSRQATSRPRCRPTCPSSTDRAVAPGDDLTHIGKRLTCLEHCALHRRTITLTCPRCRHQRRLDAVALWWMFARNEWNDHLPQAYGRFYCGPCQSDRRRVVRFHAEITRDPPDAEQPSHPDQRTWRRLVSRYRS